MAIYSLSISNVSRAAGSSSLATLSYISATRVADERLGRSFSYGRGERVLATGTMLPEGAPDDYANAEVLFNSIEDFEKASNARTAKKMIIALPREWGLDESRERLEEFIREQVTERGYACTYAIHEDMERANPHAHVLIANRQIDSKTGAWGGKRKMVYALDEAGQRIPIIDKNTGVQKVDKRNRKQWKRISVETNPLDEKTVLEAIRKGWADTANKYLAPEQQISHLSLKAQGIEREPTIHEGYAAQAIAKRGGVAERVELNKSIRAGNGYVGVLGQEIGKIEQLARQIRQAASTAVNRAVGLIEEIQAALSARFKRGTIPATVDFGGRESVARTEEHRLSAEESGLEAQYCQLGARETALRTSVERLNQRIEDARTPKKIQLKGKDDIRDLIERRVAQKQQEQNKPQSLSSQLNQLKAASKEINKNNPYRGGGRGAR